MKFIQDKLNDQGPFSYTTTTRNEANGATSTTSWNSLESDFFADSEGCRISYQTKATQDDVSRPNENTSISLKKIEGVSIMTKDQALRQTSAQTEPPGASFQVTPPSFVLRVKREQGQVSDLDFHEEAIANRVAKAMLHAVSLCGGGGSSAEPF